VDGRVAFLDGMNIRHGNMIKENPSEPVQDIHFKVSGPAIDQIATVFADDWCFAVGKSLEFSKWNASGDRGKVICRVLPDGPDEHYQKLEWTLIAAINCAERHIRIITPYFIPDDSVVRALQAASLRGVDVEIMVPEKTNFLVFNWAMASYFKELLTFGIKIYQSTPPFDHSKIFIIDDTWTLIGSANIAALVCHVLFQY
jgi:cardiolipin synthase